MDSHYPRGLSRLLFNFGCSTYLFLFVAALAVMVFAG